MLLTTLPFTSFLFLLTSLRVLRAFGPLCTGVLVYFSQLLPYGYDDLFLLYSYIRVLMHSCTHTLVHLCTLALMYLCTHVLMHSCTRAIGTCVLMYLCTRIPMYSGILIHIMYLHPFYNRTFCALVHFSLILIINPIYRGINLVVQYPLPST